MKKALGKMAGAVALIAAIVLGPALQAQAADGWVYVVVNNRVCGSNIAARGILASVPQSGWSLRAWDNGDNIVYPKVRLNTRNQFIAQVRCERRVGIFWQTVGYRTVSQWITPTRHGQTIWVG